MGIFDRRHRGTRRCRRCPADLARPDPAAHKNPHCPQFALGQPALRQEWPGAHHSTSLAIRRPRCCRALRRIRGRNVMTSSTLSLTQPRDGLGALVLLVAAPAALALMLTGFDLAHLLP